LLDLALPVAARFVPVVAALDLLFREDVLLLAPIVGVVAVTAMFVLLVVEAGEVVAAFIRSLTPGVLGVRGLLGVPPLPAFGPAGSGLNGEAVVLGLATWARSFTMRCMIALGVQPVSGER